MGEKTRESGGDLLIAFLGTHLHHQRFLFGSTFILYCSHREAEEKTNMWCAGGGHKTLIIQLLLLY